MKSPKTVLFCFSVAVVCGVGWQPSALLAQSSASAAADRMYADAASFQNNEAYELAAQEWAKFLQQFAGDPRASKAQHYAGVCNMKLRRFEKAIAAFRSAAAGLPKSELKEEAYLNLGWCLFTAAKPKQDKQLAQAVAAFDQLLDQFPEGKRRDQAYYFKGDAAYASGDFKVAIDSYQKVVEQHADSDLLSDAMYGLGVTLQETAKYDEAATAYGEFLKKFSNNSFANDVRMRAAETTLLQGLAAEGEDQGQAQALFKQSESQYAQVLSIEDFESADYAMYRQSYSMLKQGDYGRAARRYEEVSEKFADSAYADEARMWAGRCYYQAEEFAAATDFFGEVIKQRSDNLAEAGHWVCRIHLRQGEPAQAVKVAETLLPLAKNEDYRVRLQMDLADAKYELPAHRDEALDAYARLAVDRPDHPLAPKASYNAAVGLLESKRPEEAIKQAERFLQAFADHALVADVKYVVAESHLVADRCGQARKIYAQLAQAYPQHEAFQTWLVRAGFCLFVQKDYAKAIAALDGVLGDLTQPAVLAEANYLLGTSHFYRQQFDQAREKLSASLAADGDWGQADEAMLYLARAEHALEKTEQARRTIDQLIDRFSSSPILDQAYYRRAEYADAARDYQAASRDYEQVVRKWPKSTYVPFALYGQGWSHLKAKQSDKAIVSFTALIEQHRDHRLAVQGLLARATAYRNGGSPDRAVKDLERYLEMDPTAEQTADALYELGMTHVAANKLPAAVKAFQRILALGGDHAQSDKVLYELGWALKSQQDETAASKIFRQLANAQPDSPYAAEALFHVGEWHYANSKYSAAAGAYGQARAKARDELAEKVLYKLGWAHFQQQKFDVALDSFQQQVAAHPEGALAPDGMFMQGECLFKQEEYEPALQAFRQAMPRVAQSDVVSEAVRVLTLLHAGQSAAQLDKWQESLQLIDSIPLRFPNTPFLAEAVFERGRAQQNLGKLDAAFKDFEMAANQARDAVGAQARFMMGEVLFAQKRHADAILQYQRVMFGFGGEKAPDSIKTWQAYAGYEAARCAEVQIQAAKGGQRQKLINDAKAWYTFVVQKHPHSEFVEPAKKRLEALSKL